MIPSAGAAKVAAPWSAESTTDAFCYRSLFPSIGTQYEIGADIPASRALSVWVRRPRHGRPRSGALSRCQRRRELDRASYLAHSVISRVRFAWHIRQADGAEIKNETGTTVRALSVRADDIVLAFDLPPTFDKTVQLVPSDDPSGVCVVVNADVEGQRTYHAAETIERNAEPARTSYTVKLTRSKIVIARSRDARSASPTALRDRPACVAIGRTNSSSCQ